jgi:hypothetical protein
MDAVAPALIGIGLYLSYVAWESHKNGTAPNPLTNIINAVQGKNSVPSGTAQGAGESPGINALGGSTSGTGVQGPTTPGEAPIPVG